MGARKVRRARATRARERRDPESGVIAIDRVQRAKPGRSIPPPVPEKIRAVPENTNARESSRRGDRVRRDEARRDLQRLVRKASRRPPPSPADDPLLRNLGMPLELFQLHEPRPTVAPARSTMAIPALSACIAAGTALAAAVLYALL